MTAPLRPVDAVIVVPGIMGSQLEDMSGKVLWGLRPDLLAGTWVSDRAFAELQVTPQERSGTRGRVFANGLLRFPGHLPLLGGIEPYTDLVDTLRASALHPQAVRSFAYDWRLPVEWHVAKLVDACRDHLRTYRELLAARHPDVDRRTVRVAVVAHSMGGLLARLASYELLGQQVISRVITLGTPYRGSINSVEMMVTGDGMPFPTPTIAARNLARSCPGVYDLLPRYSCIAPLGQRERDLTPADLGALCPQPGAAASVVEQAEAAAERWQRAAPILTAEQEIPLHHLVGGNQPTSQTISVDAGLATFRRELDGADHSGDGTVCLPAAQLEWAEDYPLAQQHGALAKGRAIYYVQQKLLKKPLTATLGYGDLGLDAPTMLRSGAPVTVAVDNPGLPLTVVRVISEDLDTLQQRSWQLSRTEAEDTRLIFGVDGLPRGLHRIVVTGGTEQVAAITLATTGA